MTLYPQDQTLRAALRRYFDDNGFGASGGYEDDWVDFKVGPLPLPFPNTASRKRAVRLHDLHHIVTGFTTDLAGEFEIAAWEIASGYRDHVAAWHLNLAGLFVGALTMPRRTFRAFVQGRHMENFYARDYESLLDLSVGDARSQVGAHAAVPPVTAGDATLFGLAVLAGGVVATVQLAVGLPVALLAAPWLHLAARRGAGAASPRGRA